MAKIGKLIKIAAGTAIGVGAVYLTIGEVFYEKVLGRKATCWKNDLREATPEMMKLIGKADDLVDPDLWYIANKPEYTTLVNTKGKTTYSHIFKQPEYTNKWAVVIHGYTSEPQGMANQAMHFYKAGFNVLLPAMISFGPDEGKYCTMGYHDRYNVKEWIEYIVNDDEDAQIVMLGVSMGSATTMLVTGEEDLAENVKCAIADCGYSSCWDEFCNQCMTMFGLKPFPFIHAANTVSKLRGNFDFRKCLPIEAVAKSKTPTLFVHGELDDVVPFEMLDKVYGACTAEKQKLILPNAMHAEACDVYPELYYNTIDAFIGKYIK